MKYNGIKKACALTKLLPRCDACVRIDYDFNTKRLYSTLLGSASEWLRYNDNNMCTLLDVYYPMTMKELEEEIDYYITLKIEERKNYENEAF